MYFSVLLLATTLAFFQQGRAQYDYNLGNITLMHSENSYCDVSTIMTRQNKGVLTGFVPTYQFTGGYDQVGYVGYTPSQTNIYVVFRGSSDLENWLADINIEKIDYPYCDKCEVHKGFYKAETEVFPKIYNAVSELRKQFPAYNVVFTGHSLGAALTTLAAMDYLQNDPTATVILYNYGSPRVGNDQFAEWFSSNMKMRARVTHHKDIVVHSPTHERFTHISGEYYEPDDEPFVQTCVGYEDPNCSYQWHITSVSDHLLYMGVVLGQDGCGEILN